MILSDALKNLPEEHLTDELKARLMHFESPEFTGHVIERLWRDPKKLNHPGSTRICAELAKRYGIADVDGKQPIHREA